VPRGGPYGSLTCCPAMPRCSAPVTTFSSWFFFSSRRRHTRSKRDWSSDVCSSDLTHPDLAGVTGEFYDRTRTVRADPQAYDTDRSEERRVGKECRTQWATDQ